LGRPEVLRHQLARETGERIQLSDARCSRFTSHLRYHLVREGRGWEAIPSSGLLEGRTEGGARELEPISAVSLLSRVLWGSRRSSRAAWLAPSCAAGFCTALDLSAWTGARGEAARAERGSCFEGERSRSPGSGGVWCRRQRLWRTQSNLRAEARGSGAAYWAATSAGEGLH